MLKTMRSKLIIVLLIAFFACPIISSASMSSTNYQIWQDAISVGGGQDQSSGNYDLSDTLGELAIGHSSSSVDSIKAGFRETEYYLGYEVLSLAVDSSSLDLGELDSEQETNTSHTITVNTNSYHGLSVTFSGNTLTCSSCTGVNTISAIGSSAAASDPGTSQFGFNVVFSSGTSPTASAVSPYNSSGSYAFNSGDEIISASRPINETVFDVTFIANISGDETAGSYSAAITYTATANF